MQFASVCPHARERFMLEWYAHLLKYLRSGQSFALQVASVYALYLAYRTQLPICRAFPYPKILIPLTPGRCLWCTATFCRDLLLSLAIISCSRWPLSLAIVCSVISYVDLMNCDI